MLATEKENHFSKGVMKLMTRVDWNEFLMSQSSLIMPTIILITGHFSNSAELLKFRSKGQIPWLSSKFCRPQKTVCPRDKDIQLEKNFHTEHYSHCITVTPLQQLLSDETS